VLINGQRIIIGARWNADNGPTSGLAKVYEYNSGFWTQLGSNIYGETSSVWFGKSVAMSSDGTIVAVAAPHVSFQASSLGRVMVFQYVNNDWVQLGNTLYGYELGDRFGESISMSSDGTRIAIGVPSDDTGSNNSGLIRVFELDNNTWSQIGQDFIGSASNQNLGNSLALSPDGNRLAFKNRTSTNNIIVEIRQYNPNNNSWFSVGQPVQGYSTSFGNYLSLSTNGEKLAIGQNGSFSFVDVLEYSNFQWNRIGDRIYGVNYASESEQSHLSLSGDGKTLVIGNPSNDDAGYAAGQVRVYRCNEEATTITEVWQQFGQSVNGFSQGVQGDALGKGLALSADGTTFIVGSPNGDTSSLTNTGKTKVFSVDYNYIEGSVSLDMDNNGCDSNDIKVPNLMVVADNGTESFSTFTQNDGTYYLPTTSGDFTTTIATDITNHYNITPNFHSTSFSDLGNSDTADFCLEVTQTINDANITLFPINQARPGFNAQYQLVFHNIGTTQLNGTVVLEFDDSRLSFIEASESVSSQMSNSITFNYSNLEPFETRTIDVNFNVAAPPTTEIDDILNFTATVTPISGDHTESDNVFEFNQTVIGSYDPNDITVLEGSQILLENAGNYLHYIIRFQNTGTADAINVRVDNVLDPNLDWTTLQLERLSHPNRVEIKNGNEVSFIFNDIYLPDSTTDEPNSHGFIAYKIKPKQAIAINFQIYPNPTKDVLTITSTHQILKVEVFNSLGQNVMVAHNKTSINISSLQSGLYYVKVEDHTGNSETKKMIKD